MWIKKNKNGNNTVGKIKKKTAGKKNKSIMYSTQVWLCSYKCLFIRNFNACLVANTYFWNKTQWNTNLKKNRIS